MSSTIADFSKDWAALLRLYFPRACYGLEKARSVKLETEVNGDSLVIWVLKSETIQMIPVRNNILRKIQFNSIYCVTSIC